MKNWKDFKIKDIQDEDLKNLYKIDLAPETKTAIIKKFNMSNKSNVTLETQEDAKIAFDTFKKILGKYKVSVSGFYDFIFYNFFVRALSSADLDDIVDYVQSGGNGKKDKFQGWRFWNVCVRSKSISSKKFIDFMVANTDFDKLDDQYLICNIIALVDAHPKYQKDKNKDNMVEALKDILGGQGIYEKFSKALTEVKNIDKKIALENMNKIAEDENDDDIKEFAKKLRDNSIEIKFENNSFAVKTKKTTEVSWLKIGFGTVLMLLGIVMFASLFLAPGIVIPFLANLLSISTFTAKIALAVIGFGLAVVGGMLSVRGIINNIMYKNSPGGGPGSGRLIKMLNKTKRMSTIDNRFNPRENLTQYDTSGMRNNSKETEI